MPKHLILIHGRSTKPRAAVKKRLVLRSLVEGLRRASPNAAALVEDKTVKTTVVYYGDILNRVLIDADPEHKKGMVHIEGAWFEQDHSYDADLQKLIDRPTDKHTRDEYRALLKAVPDEALTDDVFRILSPVILAFGLTDNVIRKKLPDLGAYLMQRVVGSAIRQRLQAPLEKALRAGHDIALISHSMGCIVSYDVLWKFSRMSEYEHIRDKQVSLWMTLGSPLGDQFTKRQLYDHGGPDDGRYPANIDHWLNITARDDFVAYDGDVADDFKEMKQRGLVREIEDPERICTFWSGDSGANPHKFYGYLNHPYVGKRLAAWIEG